ncbi:MAG: hypothetical protein Q8838_02610, partial [Candidatus Phytoplasma australasiaticum]|nr:hypothetical protein [Candidatus Phytoplasma australasiaticum]
YYKKNNIQLPQRQTQYSAGYDLAAAIEINIPPQQIAIIPTGLLFFSHGEYLCLTFGGLRKDLRLGGPPKKGRSLGKCPNCLALNLAKANLQETLYRSCDLS